VIKSKQHCLSIRNSVSPEFTMNTPTTRCGICGSFFAVSFMDIHLRTHISPNFDGTRVLDGADALCGSILQSSSQRHSCQPSQSRDGRLPQRSIHWLNLTQFARATNQPIFICLANDKGPRKTQIPNEIACYLHGVLPLVVDMRCMLRKNRQVSLGLYNGSDSVLEKVVLHPDENLPEPPHYDSDRDPPIVLLKHQPPH